MRPLRVRDARERERQARRLVVLVVDEERLLPHPSDVDELAVFAQALNLRYLDGLYFVWTTVMTVGYGDSLFSSSFDPATGRRTLRITQLGVCTDADQLIRDVFARLEAAIREDPPAWHFWSEAPRFFGPPG